MSPSMDFDLKERVRLASDIVDVIGRHLELRPQGRKFVARCPWHDDRSPSLNVNPERQSWKCWVCDIGGDVFSYVMRRDGVDFPEALRTLAERAGIEYRPGGKKAEPGSPDDKATLLAAVKFAVDAYYEFFENDNSQQTCLAREYLAQRGISDASRELFRIGYAPDFTPQRWTWLVDEARRAGFAPEVLKAAGVAASRDESRGVYDMFRGRLMFPIWDPQDRAISMGGRVLPGADEREARRKYINGPETAIFSKSRQLYGLNLARKGMQSSREVLVMEGYTDVIAARQAGIESVVAVLGTALGTHHIELLRRYVDRVNLVLDGDAAGRRRAEEVLELFVAADVDMRVVTLPGGADPADFLAQEGPQALTALIATAPDALQHKLNTLTDGVDLIRDTHLAAKAIESMLDTLSRSPDPGGVRTSQMLTRLAKTFSIPDADIRRQFDARLRNARRRTQTPAAPPQMIGAFPPLGHEAPSPSPREEFLEPIPGLDRELFQIMIRFPDQAAVAVERVDPQWLKSNSSRMLLAVYQELELAGRDLDMQTVMTTIESEGLKNLYVSLDEETPVPAEAVASQSFEDRFETLLTRYFEQVEAIDAVRSVSEIETTADSESQMRALGEMLAKLRTQHLPGRGDGPRRFSAEIHRG